MQQFKALKLQYEDGSTHLLVFVADVDGSLNCVVCEECREGVVAHRFESFSRVNTVQDVIREVTLRVLKGLKCS